MRSWRKASLARRIFAAGWARFSQKSPIVMPVIAAWFAFAALLWGIAYSVIMSVALLCQMLILALLTAHYSYDFALVCPCGKTVFWKRYKQATCSRCGRDVPRELRPS